MLRTTSVIALGPSGVAKQFRISARSAPAEKTRWSLRMCSTATPSSAIAMSSTPCNCAISVSSRALTGGRESVATRTWPTRSVPTSVAISSAQRAVQFLQLAPQHLAGGRARQRGHRVQPARLLIGRQGVGAGAQRGADRGVVASHEEKCHRVDTVAVGHAHRRSLDDPRRPGGELLFEIDQVDPSAADLHQRILAACEAPAAGLVALEQILSLIHI